MGIENKNFDSCDSYNYIQNKIYNAVETRGSFCPNPTS